MKKIELTIDGKKVYGEQGEMLFDIAKRNGINIPGLCTFEKLLPFGGCRLCIVEVEGMKNLPTSCTLPAENGMIIKTTSPEIERLRRASLEFILSEHPNACLVCSQKDLCEKYQFCIRKVGITTGCNFCPKNKRCELQNTVETIGLKNVNLPFRYRGLEIETTDPFFERDYNLCILCGRCVRACSDVRGADVLTFIYRGPDTKIGTAYGKNHIEAGCQFCGACVDVCPTGALIDKNSKWKGIADKKILTICPYCSAGCGIYLEVKGNEIISSVPEDINRICDRGRFGIAGVVHNKLRATHPLVKRDSSLELTTWEDAISLTANSIKKFQPAEIAMVISTQIPLEDMYLAIKFGKDILKTKNIAFSDKQENAHFYYSLDLIKKIESSDTIVVFGTINPVIYIHLKNLIKDKNITVFHINDSETPLSRFARFIELKNVEGKPSIQFLKKLFTKEIKSKKKCLILIEEFNRFVTPEVLSLASEINGKLILLPYTSNIVGANIILKEFSDLNSINKWKGIKCLYLIGAYPPVIADFIIVQNFFLDEESFLSLGQHIDIFLPDCTFAEIDGSFINMEGKIKAIKKVIDPPGEAKSDQDILSLITERITGKPLVSNPSEINNILSKRINSFKRHPVKIKKIMEGFNYNNDHHIFGEYSYRGFDLLKYSRGFRRIKRLEK